MLNPIPDWWAFSFMGLQLAALLPLTYSHLFDPIPTFLGAIPNGFDLATDNLTSSLRVEIASASAAQSFPMIISMFVGCIWFARTSLRGQPALQQRLVKLPVYTGLFSDIWLYTLLYTKTPHSVLFNPQLWTPAMSGMIYGLPVATALKLVWLMGIGRDVV